MLDCCLFQNTIETTPNHFRRAGHAVAVEQKLIVRTKSLVASVDNYNIRLLVWFLRLASLNWGCCWRAIFVLIWCWILWFRRLAFICLLWRWCFPFFRCCDSNCFRFCYLNLYRFLFLFLYLHNRLILNRFDYNRCWSYRFWFVVWLLFEYLLDFRHLNFLFLYLGLALLFILFGLLLLLIFLIFFLLFFLQLLVLLTFLLWFVLFFLWNHYRFILCFTFLFLIVILFRYLHNLWFLNSLSSRCCSWWTIHFYLYLILCLFNLRGHDCNTLHLHLLFWWLFAWIFLLKRLFVLLNYFLFLLFFSFVLSQRNSFPSLEEHPISKSS